MSSRSLHHDNISHIAINHRFFLVDGNADLQEGRTEKELPSEISISHRSKTIVPRISSKNVVIYENNRNRYIDFGKQSLLIG